MAKGSHPRGRIAPRVVSTARALKPFGRQSVLGESAPDSMCLILSSDKAVAAIHLSWLGPFTSQGCKCTELPVSIGRRSFVGRRRYTGRHNQLRRPWGRRCLRVTGRRFDAGGAISTLKHFCDTGFVTLFASIDFPLQIPTAEKLSTRLTSD